MADPIPSNHSGEVQTGEFSVAFLTPEQRLDAIAEILATITSRIIRKRYENQNSDSI